jgi:hypothetical protein
MIRSYALAAATGLAIFTSVNAWPADPLPTETHKSLSLEPIKLQCPLYPQ